jgi:hypothetical protein
MSLLQKDTTILRKIGIVAIPIRMSSLNRIEACAYIYIYI